MNIVRLLPTCFFFLLPVASPSGHAHQIDLRIDGDLGTRVEWPRSLGGQNLDPYRDSEGEQESIDRSNSGYLEHSVCLPGHRCNFLKHDATNRIHQEGRKLAESEVREYRDVLTKKAAKTVSDYLEHRTEKLSAIKSEIKNDLERFDSFLRDQGSFLDSSKRQVAQMKAKQDEVLAKWILAAQSALPLMSDIPEEKRRGFEDYPFKTSLNSEAGEALNRTHHYKEFVRTQIDSSDTHVHEKISLVNQAEYGLFIADELFEENDQDGGHFALAAAKEFLDLALGFVPQLWPAQWGKSLYESITGENLITGKPLDELERSLAILDAVTVGLGSKVVKGITILERIAARAGKSFRIGKRANELARSAERLGLKGKEIVEFARESSKITVKLSQSRIKHILNRHSFDHFRKELPYLRSEIVEKLINSGKRTFFPKEWSAEKIVAASEIAFNRALRDGVRQGSYVTTVFGEMVTIKTVQESGNTVLRTAYGSRIYGLADFSP
ncbi:MAG: hypothetical protein HYW48_10230 [Deltaproteobacteria bacterium]|nr:hypothetical protein [Deltaproteobacteria bacterium]